MIGAKLKHVGVFTALVLLGGGTALAQSTAVTDAAKQEGKVVAYGSLESGTVDALKQAFQRKTGLQLEYWRASATKVLDRALSEYRAGKPIFDVVLTNSAPMHVLEKAGIFAKYDSAAAKEFPSEAIDPLLGPRYRNVIIGIMYNKDLVKTADAPGDIRGNTDRHHLHQVCVHVRQAGRPSRLRPAAENARRRSLHYFEQ